MTVKIPKSLGEHKYKGKHLLLVEGRVVASGTWKKVSQNLDKIYDQGKTPVLTYVPQSDTLILHANTL